jgi:hypothetical protein
VLEHLVNTLRFDEATASGQADAMPTFPFGKWDGSATSDPVLGFSRSNDGRRKKARGADPTRGRRLFVVLYAERVRC